MKTLISITMGLMLFNVTTTSQAWFGGDVKDYVFRGSETQDKRIEKEEREEEERKAAERRKMTGAEKKAADDAKKNK